METVGSRLKKARLAKGLTTKEVGLKLDLKAQTILNHENLPTVALENLRVYARIYGVSLAWLETGRGDMRPTKKDSSLKLMGQVGAGTTAHRIDEDAWAGAIDVIDLPSATDTFVLQVVGDSALPRYHHGDYLMVNRRVYLPEDMLNRYCVMDLADGRRVVKKLERINGAFVLRSQNPDSPLETDCKIVACYRIRGTLHAD